MALTPMTLRSRTTQPCTTLCHVAGGSSAHRASASRSDVTTSAGRRARTSSTTRSRGPSDELSPSTVNGAEHGDGHARSLRPTSPPVNDAVTGLLPLDDGG